MKKELHNFCLKSIQLARNCLSKIKTQTQKLFLIACIKLIRIVIKKKPNLQNCIFLMPSLSQHDGAGAQIQRYASVYSLAQFFGLGFIHKNIEKMDINHGDPFQDLNDVKIFLRDLNSKLLSLEKTISSLDPEINIIAYVDDSFIFYLKILWGSLLFFFGKKKNIYLSINQTYNFMKIYPEVFLLFGKDFRNVLLENNVSDNRQNTKIVIHVRSTNLINHDGNPYKTNIRNLLDVVREIYLNNVNASVLVHSDIINLTNKSDVINSLTSQETIRFWKQYNMLESLESGGELKSMFNQIMLEIRNLWGDVSLSLVGDPIDFWKQNLDAKFFVMSNSSLSFISAILLPKGCNVYCSSSWTFALKGWTKY